VERYGLVPFKVSSRDLEIVAIAVRFAKRQSQGGRNDSQNVQILTAVETRIPTAQLRGMLDISGREAELILGAIKTYSESFRSRPKYQSLFQELQLLAERLADTMEEQKPRRYGNPQFSIKQKF
jgi:hypothetical protein